MKGFFLAVLMMVGGGGGADGFTLPVLDTSQDVQLFRARSSRVLSLSEFYKNLETHHVKKMVFSPDLEEAAVMLDSDMPRLYVNSMLTSKIVESAVKDHVEVVVLPPNRLFAAIGSIFKIGLYLPLAYFAVNLGRSVMMMTRRPTGGGGGA